MGQEAVYGDSHRHVIAGCSHSAELGVPAASSCMHNRWSSPAIGVRTMVHFIWLTTTIPSRGGSGRGGSTAGVTGAAHPPSHPNIATMKALTPA